MWAVGGGAPIFKVFSPCISIASELLKHIVDRLVFFDSSSRHRDEFLGPRTAAQIVEGQIIFRLLLYNIPMHLYGSIGLSVRVSVN